jgi:hypothetical protein
MGIDGIGKPGSPLGPGAIGGSAGAGAPKEKFEVGEASATSSVQSSDLAALDRGEITLDQYLDARVAQAVEHLNGKLSSEQLEFVKSTLREQLRTDPVLTDLVRQATGRVAAELE